MIHDDFIQLNKKIKINVNNFFVLYFDFTYYHWFYCFQFKVKIHFNKNNKKIGRETIKCCIINMNHIFILRKGAL